MRQRVPTSTALSTLLYKAFLWFTSSLFRMLKRTLIPRVAILFFDGKNTQVDASSLKLFLEDSHSFKK